ncbi:uncharacterized protein PAE49_018439 [Odontesthes bonariensis]|uniref:uncharacterized protein LOC142401609 n=1 Tax=Odontesthes bonariensis TaxID=219752 RepID=UPI003F58DA93
MSSNKLFEAKWKTQLIRILDHLDESQFKKLLIILEKIPQGMKTGKVREEMPQIIIQYYGLDSITIVAKAMDEWIPRKDAAVQDLLRPMVTRLRMERQKKKQMKTKPAKSSCSVPNKPKAPAGQQKNRPEKNPVLHPAGGSQPGTQAGKDAQDSALSSNQNKRKMSSNTQAAGAAKPKQKKAEQKASSLEPTGSMESLQTQTAGAVKPRKKKAEKKPPCQQPVWFPAAPQNQTQTAGAVKPRKKKAEKKPPCQQPVWFPAAPQNQTAGPGKPKQKKAEKKDSSMKETAPPSGPTEAPQTQPAGAAKPRKKKAEKKPPLQYPVWFPAAPQNQFFFTPEDTTSMFF